MLSYASVSKCSRLVKSGWMASKTRSTQSGGLLRSLWQRIGRKTSTRLSSIELQVDGDTDRVADSTGAEGDVMVWAVSSVVATACKRAGPRSVRAVQGRAWRAPDAVHSARACMRQLRRRHHCRHCRRHRRRPTGACVLVIMLMLMLMLLLMMIIMMTVGTFDLAANLNEHFDEPVLDRATGARPHL